MQKTLNPVTHICSFLSARGLAMLLRPPALVSHLKVGMTSCVTRLSVCSDVSTMMTDMNPGAYQHGREGTSPCVEKTRPHTGGTMVLFFS